MLVIPSLHKADPNTVDFDGEPYRYLVKALASQPDTSSSDNGI
jgi:hypothetical protein